MGIDRNLILILSLAFIVIWVIVKRNRGGTKKSRSGNSGVELTRRVEAWFGMARERTALMDADVRTEREDQWNAKPLSERLEMTNQFLRQQFGEDAVGIYRDEEKLEIGLAWYEGGRDADS